jgi:hypothetical protein
MSGEIGGHVAAELIEAAKRRAAFAGKPGELRYGPFLKSLGWLFLLVTLGLVGVSQFTKLHGQYVPYLSLVAFFGLGALYLLIEAYVTLGSYDSTGISLRSAWTGHKRQRWSDLVSADFNAAVGWFRLRFRDGTLIRVSTLLLGHGAAMEQLEQCTGIRIAGAPQRQPPST